METTITSPIETVVKLLTNLNNEKIIRSVVTEDVTYVSLNYDNPDLKKIMPWCGTNKGVSAMIDNAKMIQDCWETIEFNPAEIFGSDERVALFGSFKYRSKVLNKVVSSPFSVFAKVKDGKVTYIQFMEDTFATAASFCEAQNGTYKNFAGAEAIVL